MTISLLLTNSERDGSLSSASTSQSPNDNCETRLNSDKSPIPQKKPSKLSGFEKLMKKKASLVGGGNLIVCPMTLIGQWKVWVLYAYVGDYYLVISAGFKTKQVLFI